MAKFCVDVVAVGDSGFGFVLAVGMVVEDWATAVLVVGDGVVAAGIVGGGTSKIPLATNFPAPAGIVSI